MADELYLSPIPGRLFRADGVLTSALAPPGDVPLMPTVAQLGDFVAGYTGDQILSGEANWGELGLATADLAGIGAEVRTAVELATEVATLASGYGAIITVGIGLMKWLTKQGSSGGGTDPLLAVLQRIDLRLRRIETEQVSEFKLQRQSTLELLQGRSRTAMWKAQDYMAQGRPQTPYWTNAMAIADFESQAAVETLVQNIDGSFWLRPANPLYLACNPSSSWMTYMPDDRAPVTDGVTWDYRWALPSVLHVISARVAVLRALGDDMFRSGTAGGNEILRYVRFVEQVRKRITGGLRALTTLRPEVIDMYPSTGRCPVAAGDIYTGRGIHDLIFPPHWTRQWFQPRLPWPVPSAQITASPRNIAELATNLATVGSFWWSVLYASTGIPELERYEGELRGLVKPGWGSTFVRHLADPFRSAIPEVVAAATAAKGLVQLTSADDHVADAGRAFRAFAVLRDDPEARQRVERFIGELLQLPAADAAVQAVVDVADDQAASELDELNAPPPWPLGEETTPD